MTQPGTTRQDHRLQSGLQLILWRHAEAEDAVRSLIADEARALTPRGHKQAAGMAKWLLERLPKHCRILVSPATRTQQTASALELPFETTPEVGLSATPESILAAAGWPHASPQAPNTVLVVGHQPTLGHVAALLMSGTDMDWSVRKGAVVWIENRARGAGEEAVLRAAMTPEML